MNFENEKKYLSVIIPLFNEAESIEKLYMETAAVCEALQQNYEIIFIDDGSTDKSFEIIEKLAQQNSKVKALQFSVNQGKSEALAAGFAYAAGDFAVTMDADLQDDPSEIPRLLNKMNEGFDLISGWKKNRKDPFSKRFPSKVWNKMVSFLSGIKLHDFNCGIKAYRNDVIRKIRVYGEMHRYLPVLAQSEGFRVGEMIVNHRPRQFGKTKFGSSRFFKGFMDLLTVLFLGRYLKKPLHFFGLTGFLSTLCGVIITGYLVVLRIFFNVYLSDRPLLFIGILLIIVGFQSISLGLLGEMLARSQSGRQMPAVRKRIGI